MTKVDALGGQGVSWHFIGAVQSNKTRPIAARFDWVHSIEREKIATRLSAQRPRRPGAARSMHRGQRQRRGEQVGGVAPRRSRPSRGWSASSPGLRLRGLMAIPRPADDFDSQRIPFRLLREIPRRPEFERAQPRHPLHGHDRRSGGGGGGRRHDCADRDRDLRSAVNSRGSGRRNPARISSHFRECIPISHRILEHDPQIELQIDGVLCVHRREVLDESRLS